MRHHHRFLISVNDPQRRCRTALRSSLRARARTLGYAALSRNLSSRLVRRYRVRPGAIPSR